jgi:hypothetical protein
MLPAILITFINILYISSCLGQSGWKLKRDRDGITIHVRELADSPLKEYKARAVIAHPIKQVFDFHSDLERHPEWVFRCTGLTILEKQGKCRIKYHTSYDIPWPMKDRDLTAEVIFTQHAGSNRYGSLTRDISTDYPIEDGVIRMPGYREEIILEKIDSFNTLIILEGYADPGGKVPPWLVNMFLVDGIYDSVINIREMLKDQDRKVR